MTPRTFTDEEKKEINDAVIKVLQTRRNNHNIFLVEQEIDFLVGAATVMQTISGDSGYLAFQAFMSATGRPVDDHAYSLSVGRDANGNIRIKKVKPKKP